MTASTAYILYLAFAIGAAAVYLMLPRPERSKAIAGALLGVAALAVLITLLVARVTEPGSTRAFFCIFAAVALFAAARVVTHNRPIFSALYFVLVVLAVAALLVLQEAEFLAVALVIVYAGAIVVTYLFVIMLAQQTGSPVYDRQAREPLLAVLIGFLLMAAVAGQAGALPDTVEQGSVLATQTGPDSPASSIAEGNTAAVGRAVMTKYVVVLEIAGVLLLIAMIGAIALSKKKVPSEQVRTARKPLGQVGKEVAPY
ncbi:MAG: NADH-quinone oxidoreductase subunit J [Phycisphaerales bacterium]|nr:MAG: NADH-quinone oxidoreductase subunit J [Phycisphaerales bacterium]